MRRHYAQYFRGLPDFKPWRTRLVSANTAEEVHAIFDEMGEAYALSL